MTPPTPSALLDTLTGQLTTPASGRKAAVPQSLSRGATGIALLHIENAHRGNGTWATAHTWVTAATAGEIDASPDAAYYDGAPAISFILHAAQTDGVSRYRHPVSTMDAYVARIAHHRLTAAHARMDRRELPAFAEYDLFYGLTGLGRHLLDHDPGNDALGRILRYLVRLIEPLQIDGMVLPGWWVGHDPDPILPTPGGHANFGLAHGIAGPLALMSTAARRGITVDGQTEAIDTICTYLDTWQQDDTGPWWPQWITRDEVRTGRVRRPGPVRPSWCYGTPGIVRALQLAAIATGDTARQTVAEHALADCLTDGSQLNTITDLGLCHGWAGLVQTAWRAAQDARTPAIGARLPYLADRLIRHATAVDAPEPGLLDGAAGLALALHTVIHDTPPLSGWDSCLLLT